MTTSAIIRAWKDAEYRHSLAAEERASLPAHPVGDIELQAADLDGTRGSRPWPTTIQIFCSVFVNCY